MPRILSLQWEVRAFQRQRGNAGRLEMPRSSSSNSSRVKQLKAAHAWLGRMKDEGRLYGTEVLAAPPGEWTTMLSSDARYRSYGTLMFLLERAHENLERQPQDSYELVAAILPFVDSVDTPDPLFRETLRGTAWKERGNTLLARNLREAEHAVWKALEIFDSHAGLGEELAKARLLLAKIYREKGLPNKALEIARECAARFRFYGNTSYYSIARFIEAWIYFGQKQFRDAYAILSGLVEEAERGGNELALARALQGAAMCARELGEHETARALRGRALEKFEAANATAELPRARWEHAVALAAEDRTSEAILELYKVRSEFLRFGMIISAASASLDIVRLKHDRGDDVTGTARELVTTFVEAGMTANAIEALAYIREEARASTLTPPKIQAARDFLKSLERHPSQIFLPPPHDRSET